MRTAQDEMNRGLRPDQQPKLIKFYSAVYEERKIQQLNKIINAGEEDPARSITFQGDTLHPVSVTARPGTKRRVGQPRVKWIEDTLQKLWTLVGKTIRPDMRYTIFSPNNEEHVQAMKEAARFNIHQPSE